MSLDDTITQDLSVTQSCYYYNQGILKRFGRWRNRSESSFSAQADGDKNDPDWTFKKFPANGNFAHLPTNRLTTSRLTQMAGSGRSLLMQV